MKASTVIGCDWLSGVFRYFGSGRALKDETVLNSDLPLAELINHAVTVAVDISVANLVAIRMERLSVGGTGLRLRLQQLKRGEGVWDLMADYSDKSDMKKLRQLRQGNFSTSCVHKIHQRTYAQNRLIMKWKANY